MKRIFLILIALMLLFPSIEILAADEIDIYIDGELLDATGKLVNGSTLVPLRAIFEAFGAKVDWEGETKTVTATKGNTTIQLVIGDNKAIKNGEYIDLLVPPQLINGRTYVPVRFVGEAFDYKVKWNGTTRTVSISTKTRNNTYETNIVKTDIKNDVVVFDKVASQEIEDKLRDVSIIENNQTILYFEELPKEIDELKIGDKFIISKTEANPLGLIGRFGGKEKTEVGYKIIVKEVYLEEIFEELDINIQSALTSDNLIEVQTPQYAYFSTGADDLIYNYRNMMVTGPGFDLKELIENIDKDYNFGESKGEFKIGLKNDVVIYDKDGDSTTKNDQLRVKGSVSLDNMFLNAAFKYDEIYDWEKFYVTFESDKTSNLSLVGELKEGIKLTDIVDSKGNDNQIDFGYVKIKGVDRAGTITLASIVFDVATLTVRPDVGDPTELPLAVIVSISMDFKGEVKTSFSLEYNYKEYVKKGINIQKKSLGKLSDYDYELDNYFIDAIDEYKKKTNEINFNAKGGANISMTAGPETMIMIGGIVPVVAEVHGGAKIDATSFKGNLKYDLTKPEGKRLDYSIDFGDIYAKAGIFASLDIKLQYEIWKLSGGFQENAKKEFIFWEYDSSKSDLAVSDLVTFFDEYGDYYTGGVITNVSNKTIKLNTVHMILYEDNGISEITTPFIIPNVIKPGETASFAEPGKQGKRTEKPVISYEFANDNEATDVTIKDIRHEAVNNNLVVHANVTTKKNLTSDIFDIILYDKERGIIGIFYVDEQIEFVANEPKEITLISENNRYINEIDKIDITIRFKEVLYD